MRRTRDYSDEVSLKLTDRHGDAGHEELHGVVPLLSLGLRVHVLLLTSVLDETVEAEQPNCVLKLRRGLRDERSYNKPGFNDYSCETMLIKVLKY